MKKRNKIILTIALVFVLLLGASYAWFNYYQEGRNYDVIAGDIYLTLNQGTNAINLEKVFPETVEKARNHENHDNEITFTIQGINASNKDMYYEILLNQGDTIENKDRFRDSELVFDLIEVGTNNEETYLLDAVSFDELNNTKIWVDTVLKGTRSNISRTYKLRMWLSEAVTIGEGRTVTYNQDTYKDHYASVKVAVRADMNEKSLPATSITRSSYVENGKSYFMTKLSNDYKLEEEGELLDTNDIIKLEITNPDNLLYFQYRDSKGNEDTTNNTSLDLTYTYNKNETIDIQVFTISRNDTNVSTDLKIKVTKNGTVVQEYVKHVNVIGNNYCLNNGFNNLADCILVTENLSNSVNDAKSYIASKGAPDVNTTAPTYEYVELITENQTYTGAAGYFNWSSGASYVFNSSTGTFALKKADGTTNASSYIALSDNLIGTYTCGTSNSGYGTCGTIYKVTSVDTANNKITGTKITYKMNSSMDSQVGLYKVVDNDGDSYIYRGNVNNNNVLFGGYYWKIIRINGDGSIRLIFNGNSLSANGNKTAGNNAAISTTTATGAGSTYPFNSNPGGPTYVGYMNTESENYWTTTTLATYANFTENTAYYFADDFETYTDAYGNRQFKLKGNTYQSKVKDLTTAQIDAHPYTCSGTNANLICNRLVKVNSRSSNTSVTGYYVTYSPNYDSNTSLTKADVEKNENDSTAKKQLELWYHDKFMNNQNNGKAVTTYLVDNPFCNDRSITRTGSYNSGYLLTTHTYFAPRTRLLDAADPNKSATLLCNKNDNFSVTETTNTNGKLDYPIGLITADEVAFAGGKFNEKNERFYLRTSGYYWTMSPSFFDSALAYACEFLVDPSGLMHNYYYVTSSYGLRAVINLSSETLITQGDGTIDNPYELTIE